MTCLCTGCWLYDPPHRRRCRGDLHSLGSVLIFNAAVQPDTRPVWEWDVEPPDFERDKAVILFDSPLSFFERRGVFTIVGSVATDALKRYVEEGKTHYAKLIGGG